MADFWSLLLILAAVYLFECFHWVRRGGIAWTTWLGGKWRSHFPGLFLSNWKGGLIFLCPIPPFGRVVATEQSLYSISPDAFFSYSAASMERDWRPAQVARFVPFDQVEKIEAREKEIYVNAEPFFKAVSETHARALAEFFETVKKAKPAERARLIEGKIKDSLDAACFKKRLDAFVADSKRLRVHSNILFVYLFGMVPLGFWIFGLRSAWLPSLTLLLLQTITISILFYRLHKKLFPLRNDDWFAPLLTMLLAPSAAIRATDALARYYFLEHHPLAIAAQLCSSAEFEKTARPLLRDLKNPRLPVCPVRNDAAIETERWYRALLSQQIETFLRKRKVDPAALIAPPAKTEAVHKSFCPRCEAQFVTASGSCGECGGLTLQPFL